MLEKSLEKWKNVFKSSEKTLNLLENIQQISLLIFPLVGRSFFPACQTSALEVLLLVDTGDHSAVQLTDFPSVFPSSLNTRGY